MDLEPLKSPDISETSNLLENSAQYVKCGESNKLISEDEDKEIPIQNITCNDTQGYETPVKIRRKEGVTTPTNECPQYYTNMNSARKSLTEPA